MKKVIIDDKFWNYYRDLIRDQMLHYQWQVLTDTIDITIEKERDDDFIPNEKSHAIANFEIAAGRKKGEHYGWVFQDSDVYKWLEAVAYSIQEKMDEDLKEKADWVVDLIAEAQEADGYLGTYFTTKEPERKFKRLSESHELYCAGHYMEAGVAYYEAVGNKKALHIACKLADCLDNYFGEEEGKRKGYDGHEEIEIGLLKLYQATAEKRYLNLCTFFLEQRGKEPDFFEKQKQEDTKNTPLIAGIEKFPLSYFQAHALVKEQDTAEGHAVRLVYLCTAMAGAARETGDKELWQACVKIWRNIVDKRMYITGGIGSTVYGESFTFDYDLPNDTMYCETCASVGLIFFAHKMLENETKGEYADVMERALYNTVLGGMALDGKHFFYVNPLEALPEASKKVPGKSHVKCVRPEWLGCACCPPNLARLLASLEKYVYVQKEKQVLAALFMNCKSAFLMNDGILEIEQETNYPWNGKVSFLLNYSGQEEIEFGIRIPDWADEYTITRNGEKADGIYQEGFYIIKRQFKSDRIILELSMETKKWHANPNVRSGIGMLSVSRGPFVYCLEEVDNERNLHQLLMEETSKLHYQLEPDLLGGVGTLYATGWRIRTKKETRERLYCKTEEKIETEETMLKWIPYYAWANRGANEMRVWIHEKSVASKPSDSEQQNLLNLSLRELQ